MSADIEHHAVARHHLREDRHQRAVMLLRRRFPQMREKAGGDAQTIGLRGHGLSPGEPNAARS